MTVWRGKKPVRLEGTGLQLWFYDFSKIGKHPWSTCLRERPQNVGRPPRSALDHVYQSTMSCDQVRRTNEE